MKTILTFIVLTVFVQSGHAQSGFACSGGGGSSFSLPPDSVTGTGKVVRHTSPTLSGNVGINVAANALYDLDVAGIASFRGYNTRAQRYGFYAGAGGNTGYIASIADGIIALQNSSESDFNMLQFGTFNSSVNYPALKRSGNRLQVRTANDGGFAGLDVDSLIVNDRPAGLATAAAFDANGVLGTLVSKRELKEEISHIEFPSVILQRLEPVKFRWKKGTMGEGLEDFGFIAEQLDSVDHRLVLLDKDGKVTDIRERALLAFAVGTIQEQAAQITDLQKRLAILEEQSSFPNNKEVSVIAAFGLLGFGFVFWLKRK